jgi:endonuclease/exonuclease/phosphatase family metal-dependent hydrolase
VNIAHVSDLICGAILGDRPTGVCRLLETGCIFLGALCDHDDVCVCAEPHGIRVHDRDVDAAEPTAPAADRLVPVEHQPHRADETRETVAVQSISGSAPGFAVRVSLGADAARAECGPAPADAGNARAQHTLVLRSRPSLDDDEDWHTYKWASPRGPIEIVYRSYGTSGDNDIEYVINPMWPPNPTIDTFNVLAYNVYMRPHLLLKNGQHIRATLLPERIDDYDVIVLSEVFDDAVRERLVDGLSATYPHRTLVAGLDRAWEQDGGVMIVSPWPIEVRDRLSFHDQQLRPITDCRGDDCHAVVYARIRKEERTFHVFGTHLQAGSDREDALVRAGQLLVIRDWMDARMIPPTETVIVAGDMNVDRASGREYTGMLLTLSASDPPGSSGHPFTVDPVANRLSGSDRQVNLDYVLLSTRHRLPTAATVETRAIRAPYGSREFSFEPWHWDLSDHFPVYGRLTFGRPAARISPPTLDFGRVTAVDQPPRTSVD